MSTVEIDADYSMCRRIHKMAKKDIVRANWAPRVARDSLIEWRRPL